MTIDRPRVAAVVRAGLQNAGVHLDAAELAQLESQTAMLLEGLDQLDELNIPLDQVEPALTFTVAKPNDNE
jgi:hypothetical protein